MKQTPIPEKTLTQEEAEFQAQQDALAGEAQAQQEEQDRGEYEAQQAEAEAMAYEQEQGPQGEEY